MMKDVEKILMGVSGKIGVQRKATVEVRYDTLGGKKNSVAKTRPIFSLIRE